MKFTDEQMGMIAAKGKVVIGNAFSGTGKTATLVGFAEANHKSKILCCVLNKSVAVEAQQRFPSNVKTLTSHALAFGNIGKNYKHKLGQPRPFQVAKAFKLPFGNEQHKVMISALALEALRQFMTLPDMTINEKHVSLAECKRMGFSVGEVINLANAIWSEMIDPDSAFPIPHDGYLKLYQLSQPRLPYDIIQLDESQDLNPVTLDIMSKQTHAQEILVGDSHQNIYGFRNSVNALDVIEADEYHYLTQSWRFGPQVAEVANRILAVFKDETRLLKGFGAEGSITGIDDSKAHTILCRTNAGIFDAAVGALDAHGDIKLTFAGGIQGYALDQLEDTWRLMKGKKSDIRDPYVKSFNSYDEMQVYAEDIDDKELKARIRVCEKYKDAVPVKLREIRSKAQDDSRQSLVTLSTSHKSKGLEWDQVKLWSDFPDMVSDKGIPLTSRNVMRMNDSDMDQLDIEEANLLYVSVTRARKALDAEGSSVERFLKSRLTQLDRVRGSLIGASKDPLMDEVTKTVDLSFLNV